MPVLAPVINTTVPEVAIVLLSDFSADPVFARLALLDDI